ncbi:FecR family protein [Gaoshiqia sp. Z1-71]|uniref:FecR family protein n=1 Tax=Gaoshiqia hydrogeniformans TaxID=3290090 RepID=UPI003BF9080C
MHDQILSLLKRFINDERLTVNELRQLRDWMTLPDNMQSLDEWMHNQWLTAPETESEVDFEELISLINRQYQLHEKKKVFWELKPVKQFQRVAAILILPVMIVSAYYYLFSKEHPLQYTETIVPKGQKSEIVLPDNTHIWLNSGTSLRYPTEYGRSTREIFLEGEAYFEVTANKHLPFVVKTATVDVKVLGTKFNVQAYPDESKIETALLEGSIDLLVRPSASAPISYEMKPGEMINFSKSEGNISRTGFRNDEVVGWKNNRLIFRDDSFVNLVRKIERWYNVEVVYDEHFLDDQRLTVELNEGESIERLMQIIEKVMNVESSVNNQKVYIKSKMKS